MKFRQISMNFSEGSMKFLKGSIKIPESLMKFPEVSMILEVFRRSEGKFPGGSVQFSVGS